MTNLRKQLSDTFFDQQGRAAFADGKPLTAAWAEVSAKSSFLTEAAEEAAKIEFRSGFKAAMRERDAARQEEQKELAARKPHIGFRHDARGEKRELYRFASLWEAAEEARELSARGDFHSLMFLPFEKEGRRTQIRVIKGEARVDNPHDRTAAIRLPNKKAADTVAEKMGWN